MELSELLRSRRKEAGLTQEALANVAGLDITTVNRLERGKGPLPRQHTILKLASAFGFDDRDPKTAELLAAANRPTPSRMSDASLTRVAESDALLANPVIAHPVFGRLSEFLAEWESIDGDIWCARNDFPSEPPAHLSSYRERFSKLLDNPRARQILQHRIGIANHRLHKLEGRRTIRYLTTRSAIKDYMEAGRPTATNHEAGYADWIFPEDERIERAQNLIDLLGHETYEVGMLEGPWPFDGWWSIYGRQRVLYTVCPGGTTYIAGAWSLRFDDLTNVNYFADAFKERWESPSVCKDKREIKGLLEGLIHKFSVSN